MTQFFLSGTGKLWLSFVKIQRMPCKSPPSWPRLPRFSAVCPLTHMKFHVRTKTSSMDRERKNLTSRVMPSSIHRCSVRSHVPVAVLLTSPLSWSTAYNGALPSSHSQISVSVIQPPRVLPSPDSTYSRSDPEEYRSETMVLWSQSGLAIASLGDAVSAASARLATRRLMITAVRSGVVVAITICGKRFAVVRSLHREFQRGCLLVSGK